MRKLLSLAAAAVLFAAIPAAASANLFAKYKQQCGVGVTAQVDPIASPGQPADHNHTESGTAAFTANMTTGAMFAASTTCFLKSNHSAYWAPTFEKNGVSYPAAFSAYYAANGADPAGIADGKIMPFPVGFRKIIGDSHSTVLQSPNYVRWRCGESVNTTTAPPTTANCSTYFYMEIDDQTPCWDGMSLDSPDHKSHTAGPTPTNGCPADHPVRLPQIQAAFGYGPGALGGMLSSDHGIGPAGRSAHFDVWEAQDPSVQDQLTRCLNDPNRNSLSSGTCGVFTYGNETTNPWQVQAIAWANVIGYVKSNGDPNYGGFPSPTP